MKFAAKPQKKPLQMIKALFVSYLITLVLLLLIAFVLYKLEMSETFARVGVILSYIVSSFTGGFLMGRSSEKKRYLWGILFGVAYFLVILVAALFMNQDLFHQSASVITVFVMCILGGMLGGMVS